MGCCIDRILFERDRGPRFSLGRDWCDDAGCMGSGLGFPLMCY